MLGIALGSWMLEREEADLVWSAWVGDTCQEVKDLVWGRGLIYDTHA